MRRYVLFLFAGSLGLLCLQCSRPTGHDTPDPAPVRTPANLTPAEQSLLGSSNQFGLKLFTEIASRESSDANIFISPLSVSYALGMAYNGAAGETREAIAATLKMADLSLEEINKSYGSLTAILSQADPTVVFNIANSMWYRQGLPVEQEFINLNQTYFDALVRELDFDAPWAADTINHWVDVNTNGKIEKIIDPPIDRLIILYLMNAIYFKGAWTNQFDTALTHSATFYRADSSQTTCRMMSKDTLFDYFENDLLTAVNLPYGQEGFKMTVLLPKPSYSVDDVIAELTPDNWEIWLGSFEERRAMINLPKFKLEYELSLKAVLKAMGMEIAFSSAMADFSNILAGGGLWIGEVKHKTFVQVDEEGTEAAAVTVVVFPTSMPPTLRANRPFLFVIHEESSGSILFIGRIADPVWQD